MVVIIRHKYATAHSKAAYLRQIGGEFNGIKDNGIWVRYFNGLKF